MWRPGANGSYGSNRQVGTGSDACGTTVSSDDPKLESLFYLPRVKFRNKPDRDNDLHLSYLFDLLGLEKVFSFRMFNLYQTSHLEV